MVIKSVKITLYYADWCGHCINFKPEWNKLKEKIQKLNDKSIIYEEFEEKDIKPEWNIEGFPTIKLTIDFKDKAHIVDYGGKRNSDILYNILTQIKQIK